tara:strand:+ start:7198 stop:8208 length:1011 start_codon:yes stop_codon:yes gene_type:complete
VSQRLSIAVVVHHELIPDLSIKKIKKSNRLSFPWITEWDVANSLLRLGHEVLFYPIEKKECINDLIKDVCKFDLVFNLLEEVESDPKKDFMLPKILGEKGIPYSGCNAKELSFGRDKILTKKKLVRFVQCPRTLSLSDPRFPLILKFNNEDGSYGIFKKNICAGQNDFLKRLEFLKEHYEGEIYAEEFVPGIEAYVSLFKNSDGEIITFPPRELTFPLSKSPEKEIYSQTAKWSEGYQSRQKIETVQMTDQILAQKLKKLSENIYRGMNFSGPMRIDFRCNENGEFLLEINPNPNLAIDDDFYLSMKSVGTEYDEMIRSILEVAMNRVSVEVKSAA